MSTSNLADHALHKWRNSSLKQIRLIIYSKYLLFSDYTVMWYDVHCTPLKINYMNVYQVICLILACPAEDDQVNDCRFQISGCMLYFPCPGVGYFQCIFITYLNKSLIWMVYFSFGVFQRSNCFLFLLLQIASECHLAQTLVSQDTILTCRKDGWIKALGQCLTSDYSSSPTSQAVAPH